MIRTASVFLLLVTFSCQGPEVIKGRWEPGKVDLEGLSTNKDGAYALDGPWKYTLKQFLSSEAFETADLPDTGAFFHGWLHFLPNGPNFGSLSARLVVTLPQEGQTWGVILPDNYTAYSLYANGRLVTKIGNASLSPAHHRAVVRPETVMFQVPGRELELILYNSNQEMFSGGFFGTILLAREEVVMKEASRRMALSLFSIGIIATVGVLYLLIFFLNVRIRYNLFFGLLSLIVSFRMALMDQRILVILTDMAFPLESDLEYGAVLAAMMVLGWLIRDLFPKAVASWPLRIILVGHAFFFVALVILPIFEFAQLFIYYSPLLFGTLLFYLYALVRALQLRLPGSGFFLFQVIFLGLAGILDFYNSMGLHSLGFHFSEVFLLAVIVQALWMAIRRSRLLDESKKMSTALMNFELHRNQVMDSVARELPGRILAVSQSLQRIGLNKQDFSLSQQKLYGTMKDSHDRLESLVDDLRSYLDSKTDRGPNHLISLDLGEVLREVSGNLPEKQFQQRLNLQVKSGTFPVKSDPSRLRVALKILLLHLLRLKPGNPVMLEAGKLGDGEVWLSLTLMNHWWQRGQLADIFSPFAGEPDGSRSLKGSILDLPLAREYLTHAGVRLEAVNQGPGARFTLVLASGEASALLRPPKVWENIPEVPDMTPTTHFNLPVGQKPESRAHRLPGDGQILAVDDEPINLRLLSHQLSLIGWNHLTAESGLAALEKIHSARINLVLLDVMMPVMDGLKVLQDLRKLRTRENLPVVLVTAKSLPEDRLEGLNCGANAYMVKPFTQDQLKNLLTRLIRRLAWMEQHTTTTCDLPLEVVVALPTGHPEINLPLPDLIRLQGLFFPRDREYYRCSLEKLDVISLVKILETQDLLRDLALNGILKNWGLGLAGAREKNGPGQALELAKISWDDGGGLLSDDAAASVLPALTGLQVVRSPAEKPSFRWEDS